MNALTPIADFPLSRLSYNCWLEIIGHLSLESTLSLSTTCKAIHASTEPLLYTKIIWNLEWRVPLRRFLRLLRTILARPDLASSMRYVSLIVPEEKEYCGWFEPDMDWTRESASSRDVVEGSIDIIERAQFPYAEAKDWISALQTGNAQAFIAVFISQLPMLRYLRLDYEFTWRGRYLDRMVKHALLSSSSPSSTNKGVLSTFSLLELVDYGGNVRSPFEYRRSIGPIFGNTEVPDGFRGPYNKDRFIEWFCIPSIRHLEIRVQDLTELRERQQEDGVELNLRYLRTLVLARSTIPEKDILFLLSHASSLRNLNLGLAYRRLNPPVLEDRMLVAQALESVSDTVENLSMGFEYYSRCDMCEAVRDEMIEASWEPLRGILKNFTKLRTLEIPVPILLGLNPDGAADLDLGAVLPDTLVKLCLNDLCELPECEEWTNCRILNRMHVFLTTEDWRSSTPLLQRLQFRLWGPASSVPCTNSEKQLRLTCIRKRLDLEFCTQELPVPIGM